jgi:cytochrome P450
MGCVHHMCFYLRSYRVNLQQEEILMLSDPKALHYILHASGYHYPKKDDVNQSIRLFMGTGIFWASGSTSNGPLCGILLLKSLQGDTHKRHKKVMNPAFEANKLRSFVPLFQRSAELVRYAIRFNHGTHTKRIIARGKMEGGNQEGR